MICSDCGVCEGHVKEDRLYEHECQVLDADAGCKAPRQQVCLCTSVLPLMVLFSEM